MIFFFFLEFYIYNMYIDINALHEQIIYFIWDSMDDQPLRTYIHSFTTFTLVTLLLPFMSFLICCFNHNILLLLDSWPFFIFVAPAALALSIFLFLHDDWLLLDLLDFLHDLLQLYVMSHDTFGNFMEDEINIGAIFGGHLIKCNFILLCVLQSFLLGNHPFLF